MLLRKIKIIALVVVVAILFVTGGLFAQVAQHAIHHAHHQSATHGTFLCAWMCAAGEVHEGVAPYVAGEIGLVGLADGRIATTAPLPLTLDTSPRAPPVTLT